MRIRWPTAEEMKAKVGDRGEWEAQLCDYYRLVLGIDVRLVEDDACGHGAPSLAVVQEIGGVLVIRRVHQPSREFMEEEMDRFGLVVHREHGLFVVSDRSKVVLAKHREVSRAIMGAAVKKCKEAS